MEEHQSNCLFLTLRKTSFLMQVSFSAKVRDYIKICKSVPGNWDPMCCLVSTDVSRFDFFLNYIIDLYGKPHKSRFDVSVPAQNTATILHC